MPIRRAVIAVFLGMSLAASLATAQLAIDEKLFPAVGSAISWIDLDGETLVVSQGQDNLLVYERTFAGWQLAQTLAPPPGVFGEHPTETIWKGVVSGYTIAAVVQGPIDPATGLYMFPGKTVIYSNLGGSWVHVDTLDFPAGELQGDQMIGGVGNEQTFWERNGGAWSQTSSVASPVAHPSSNWRVVARRGDTAIGVATTNPDDVSVDSSAVYELRRTAGGAWLNLGPFDIPDGNPSGGLLGPSAVGDDYLAIGARGTDGNGQKVGIGIVYIFGRTNLGEWLFLQSLQPRDLEARDGFGSQVAIDGDRLLVAAWGDDSGAENGGAVYVFERAGSEFVQVEKIVPADIAPNDTFGRLLGISGDRVAILSNNGPLGAVYTYGCGPDSDGDGLCDDWETTGIPYLDSNGNVQRYLLDIDGNGVSDADPEEFDLFVEIDVMSGDAGAPNMVFGAAEVQELEVAFGSAPVASPQGFNGIDLHLDVQQDVFPFELVSNSVDGFPDDLIVRERLEFGSPVEQADDEAEAILNAKAKAFRYGVAFHDVQITTEGNARVGGFAEIVGDDFVVYLSSFGDAEARAATTMHELGHTLGLRHGGSDDINGKPNYPSVMNYLTQNRASWNTAFWELDYSHEALATLDEGALDEYAPIGIGSSGMYDGWKMKVALLAPPDSICVPMHLRGGLVSALVAIDRTTQIDWNLDCDTPNTAIAYQNVNAEFDATPDPELLDGYDDWSNIRLPPSDGGGAWAGAKVVGEPTIEMLQLAWSDPDIDLPEPGFGVALGLGLLQLVRLARRRQRPS